MNLLNVGNHKTNPRFIVHSGSFASENQTGPKMILDHHFNHSINVTIPPAIEEFHAPSNLFSSNSYLEKVTNLLINSYTSKGYVLSCKLSELIRSLDYTTCNFSSDDQGPIVCSVSTNMQTTIAIYNGTLHLTLDRETYQTFGIQCTEPPKTNGSQKKRQRRSRASDRLDVDRYDIVYDMRPKNGVHFSQTVQFKKLNAALQNSSDRDITFLLLSNNSSNVFNPTFTHDSITKKIKIIKTLVPMPLKNQNKSYATMDKYQAIDLKETDISFGQQVEKKDDIHTANDDKKMKIISLYSTIYPDLPTIAIDTISAYLEDISMKDDNNAVTTNEKAQKILEKKSKADDFYGFVSFDSESESEAEGSDNHDATGDDSESVNDFSMKKIKQKSNKKVKQVKKANKDDLKEIDVEVLLDQQKQALCDTYYSHQYLSSKEEMDLISKSKTTQFCNTLRKFLEWNGSVVSRMNLYLYSLSKYIDDLSMMNQYDVTNMEDDNTRDDSGNDDSKAVQSHINPLASLQNGLVYATTQTLPIYLSTIQRHAVHNTRFIRNIPFRVSPENGVLMNSNNIFYKRFQETMMASIVDYEAAARLNITDSKYKYGVSPYEYYAMCQYYENEKKKKNESQKTVKEHRSFNNFLSTTGYRGIFSSTMIYNIVQHLRQYVSQEYPLLSTTGASTPISTSTIAIDDKNKNLSQLEWSRNENCIRGLPWIAVHVTGFHDMPVAWGSKKQSNSHGIGGSIGQSGYTVLLLPGDRYIIMANVDQLSEYM